MKTSEPNLNGHQPSADPPPAPEGEAATPTGQG